MSTMQTIHSQPGPGTCADCGSYAHHRVGHWTGYGEHRGNTCQPCAHKRVSEAVRGERSRPWPGHLMLPASRPLTERWDDDKTTFAAHPAIPITTETGHDVRADRAVCRTCGGRGALFEHGNDDLCCECARVRGMVKPGDACYVAPTPPTLAEWMGAELQNLPPEWREVLREQPVPAGMIRRITWEQIGHNPWAMIVETGKHEGQLVRSEVIMAVTGQYTAPDHLAWQESLQMAMFERHPAVAPTPRPIQCWAPYEQQGDDL